MSYFGKFYLDKEKDIIVNLYMENQKLIYIIQTPNHGTGNLISNIAKLTGLDISYDENGLKVIAHEIPAYVNGDNETVYVMRLSNVKVANIYPDGRIERKAYIPAIAKTLMSQTKDYSLDINKTLVKTYIPLDVKFHADLHSHRSANLSPDILIALGIRHQIRYPYYYVKKLNLCLTDTQRAALEAQRRTVALKFTDSGLTGKYLDRRIDDNTEINFADLILNNPVSSQSNISKIRASLAIMKDGQAVFTNLEKVYLYRYVFAKGTPAKKIMHLSKEDFLSKVSAIDDCDIVAILRQMIADSESTDYCNNTLYQDKLLWTARSYANVGVTYAEISDTALVKRSDAAKTLGEIHEIMPKIIKETGVTLRFLAAFRRIPLTIIKNEVDKENYFIENLQVLKAVSKDPYIAGSDFVGEEINDIRELKSIIRKIVGIADGIPGFVIRIHAGENDSLPDNVMNSIACVEEALAEGQAFPYVRIGHGLYTAKLNSQKGKQLLSSLKEKGVVLEFQITSNVRLNNLTEMSIHPLKQYLSNGVACVQGTDGGAIYGTDSMDEQLSLITMLNLDIDDLQKMHKTEEMIINDSLLNFSKKSKIFADELHGSSVEEYYTRRIADEADSYTDISLGERKYLSEEVFSEQIKELPESKVPIVVIGGSFNNATHVTRMTDSEKLIIDNLLSKADPDKVFFVIGSSFTGYEKYLFEKAKDRFQVFSYVPVAVTGPELHKLKKNGADIRVSIESSPLGIYKSIAFEIFKRRRNIILAFDGNSAAANLIQDAKNSKYESRRFINAKSKGLRSKADSLMGYITYLSNEKVDEILKTVDKYL